ncbi:hypothetical protein LINPERPRIM_LOCUS23308 [Linum perenne]
MRPWFPHTVYQAVAS